MSIVVVDASVVIKWYLPEVHGEAALSLLASPDDFIAPDHLFAETTNAIWAKWTPILRSRSVQHAGGGWTHLVSRMPALAAGRLPEIEEER